MMCYKLDKSKPIKIIQKDFDNNLVLIEGYAEAINCSEDQKFGSEHGFWTFDPNRLKINDKHLRNQARQAKRTGNKKLLHEVWASVLTQLEGNNNNNGRS